MHGSHTNAIVMRRPDGSPMTRQEVIIRRRGALKWLPVLFSNDLVHGSWWFTIGSFFTAVFAVYPLVQKYINLYEQHDDLLPATDYDITWALLIISGVFLTLGSLAFVHAFEEPPRQAIFHNWKHAQTDELLGAWFFLLSAVPAVPYMLVFFSITPSAFYFFGLIGAIVFVLGSGLFVKSCYPNDIKHENYILPLCIGTFGAQMWVVKHLANDWLAGTWFFLWANAILTLASLLLLFVAIGIGNPEQIFIWLSGTASSLLFLIGSMYFVSGSYPHATQFYYTTDRGRTDTISHEVYADEVGLVALSVLNATVRDDGDSNALQVATNPLHLGSLAKQDYSLAPSVRRNLSVTPVKSSSIAGNPGSSGAYGPLASDAGPTLPETIDPKSRSVADEMNLVLKDQGPGLSFDTLNLS